MGDFADDMEALSGLIPDEDEALWKRFDRLEKRIEQIEAILARQGWVLVAESEQGIDDRRQRV